MAAKGPKIARAFQLTVEGIRGKTPDTPVHGRTSNATQDALDAWRFLRELHERPCNLSHSTILWKRMPSTGVSNDLNGVVRSFAIAVRDRRQLVLLPPTNKVRRGLQNRTGGMLSMERPWHWLSEGTPLSSILHPSSCQLELERTHSQVLDEMGAQPESASISAATRLGIRISQSKDHDVSNRWFVEIGAPAVPARFQRHGMLWWFQMLTVFLVRITGGLAEQLRSHPAMAPFLGLEAPAATEALEHPVAQGWTPDASFDFGVHVRQGDACGREQALKHPQRRCLATLREALKLVEMPPASSAFVASDSAKIVEEAQSLRQASQLRPYSLDLNREK